MKDGKNKANKHEKAGNNRPGKKENERSKPGNKEKGAPVKKENRRQIKNGNGKPVKENGTLGKKEKTFLLALARSSIESRLETENRGNDKESTTTGKAEQAGKSTPAREATRENRKIGAEQAGNRLQKPPEILLEPGAAFVTLHLGEELRGCIGSLEAYRPLVQDVASNALNSAFRDPRFAPVTSEELKAIKISISVLTKPKPLEVKDAKDLLLKLKADKHGLTLRKGSRSATFLPAVWEELPEKADFLSHLCYKAGLPPDAWRNTKSFEFETYEANEFSE